MLKLQHKVQLMKVKISSFYFFPFSNETLTIIPPIRHIYDKLSDIFLAITF